MLKPELLDEVREVLIAEDFYAVQHRSVYEAILALDASDRAFDVVTVSHQLEAVGKLRMIGGPAFLSTLIDATPTVANVLDHARIVHELGLLRRMGDTLLRLAGTSKMAETRVNVGAFLERCEAEVLSANAAESERETASGIDEMMAAAVTDLTKPREQSGQRGVTTGFLSLDEISLGFVPGELWYLAARPGMGKTALALCMAAAVAETGRGAVFFSMEMKRPELTERMLAAGAGVNAKRLHRRELGEQELADVLTAAGRLARYPLRFDDTASLTPGGLRSRVRRHVAAIRAKTPLAYPALIVVDYVQLMTVERRSGSRNEDLEEISRALKILAGEYKCTVLALSQLKRPDPRAPVTRPSLGDLRGSGALEQDADKVLFVHRAPDDDPDANGDAELILEKGRNSGRGKAKVVWAPWCVRFENAVQRGFDFTRIGDGGPAGPDD